MPRPPKTPKLRVEGTGPDGTFRIGDLLGESSRDEYVRYVKERLDGPVNRNEYSPSRTYVREGALGPTSALTRVLPPDAAARLEQLVTELTDGRMRVDELLSDVLAEGQPTSAVGARRRRELTSDVLRVNRFNPDAPYDPSSLPDQVGTVGRAFGSSAAAVTIDRELLQKVGHILMLRAAGEFFVGDPENPAASAATLTPGQAQLGSPIDASTMSARAAYDTLTNGGISSSRTTLMHILTSPTSVGVMNTPNEPFDGFAPAGMIALAVSMVVTLRVTVGAVAQAIARMNMQSSLGGTRESSYDQLEFGQHGVPLKQGASLLTLRDIGVKHVDRDLADAVAEGVRVFFGVEGRDLVNVMRAPGYYANLARTLVQSGFEFTQDVVDAFRRTTQNLVEGAQMVAGLVDQLRSSKAVALVNIFAQIGDASLRMREAGIDTAPRGSYLDGLPEGPRTRVGKSRGEDGRLTKRGSSTPSALLVPQSLHVAASRVGASSTSYEVGASKLRDDDPDTSIRSPEELFKRTRLPKEVVDEFEILLDSEYVPFYFHDLRTNEIVAFHAFIDSCMERLAADYGTSKFYGRVDPIMTYSATTRTFSLSFSVVATSADDMDLMYVKLNKLATLMYPQWTRGRLVKDADGRQFRQPFSQLPGATPVVRIRLGDVVKSNFNLPGLARLFGANEDTFLDAQTVSRGADPTRVERELRNRISANGWSPRQIARLDVVPEREARGITTTLGGAPSKTNVRRDLMAMLVKGGLFVEVVRQVDRRRYRNVDERHYLVRPTSSRFEGVEFIVPHSVMRLTSAEVSRILAAAQPDDVPAALADEADTREFLDPYGDSNAIVRSFRSVRGKGLAGVITSLQFDWQPNSGQWETNRFGARAPRYCKVSLEFTVIHDLPPGIDADGVNMGPLYPVGEYITGYTGDVYDGWDRSRDRFESLSSPKIVSGG